MRKTIAVLFLLLSGCAFNSQYALGPATCESKEVGGFWSTQMNTVCWKGDQIVGFGSTAGSSVAELIGAGVIAGGVVGSGALIANQVGTKVAVGVAK